MDLQEQHVDLLDFTALSAGLLWAFPQGSSPESLCLFSRRNPRGCLRLHQAVRLQFWQWMCPWSQGMSAGKEGWARLGFSYQSPPGSCCSQRPTESIRKCLLVIQTRAVLLKCKLKPQPSSCLRVHPELKYLRDECVIVASKGVDLSPFLLISCSDSLPLTFSSREFLIYLP